jgi:hypothetical protein
MGTLAGGMYLNIYKLGVGPAGGLEGAVLIWSGQLGKAPRAGVRGEM